MEILTDGDRLTMKDRPPVAPVIGCALVIVPELAAGEDHPGHLPGERQRRTWERPAATDHSGEG